MNATMNKIESALGEHSSEIARINGYGAVAVLVVEPDETARRVLRMLGWDGKSPVFRLGAGTARLVARQWAEVGDHVAARWLKRDSARRVLVCAHSGTLMMNSSDGSEWILEPGSTNRAAA